VPRDRFCNLGTKKIELSDGDWVEVKTGLTAGDQRKQDSLALSPVMINGDVVDHRDWSLYEFLRTDLWVVAWSLIRNGQPVPKTVAALQALEPEEFDEINNAVYAHIKEWADAKKAKRAAAQTAQPGSSASPTST
jgi:hypothetical protein